MKCPLFILTDRRAQSGEETEIGDCLSEDCAWWLESNKTCAVLCIAQAGIYLHKAMLDISTFMPRA